MPDLFRSGTLDMSTEPLQYVAGTLQWGDVMVNRIAVMVLVILLILSLPDLIRLYPQLLRCMSRWKGNLELEHSVSLARTRNNVALVAGIAVCLIADRWQLADPSFRQDAPESFKLAITAALLTGTAALHRLFYVATKFRSLTNEYASTLRHTVFNYLILLTSLMLVTVLLTAAFRVPDAVVRKVLNAECIVFYVVHLIRFTEILRSRCGLLATFLYLCALEILPIGILVFTCTQ